MLLFSGGLLQVSVLFVSGCEEPKRACTEGYVSVGHDRCDPVEGLFVDSAVPQDSGLQESDTGEPVLAPEIGLAFDSGALHPKFLHRNAIWAGVSLLDFDGDGWLDIFFPNGFGGADALYWNQGDGTFLDVAAQAGVASLAENGGSVAGDLDNDGDTDLVVNTVCSTGSYTEEGLGLNDGNKIVYHNNGDGTFTQQNVEVPAENVFDPDPLSMCTTSMTLVDWNQDGFLDIALANHIDPDLLPPWLFGKKDSLAKNMIFINDGTGNFGELIQEYRAGNNYFVSFVLSFFDVNADGAPDLFQGQGGAEVGVILNPQDGTYGRVSEDRSGSGDGLWMGMAVADFDGDDDLDIYATNQGLSPYIIGYDNTISVYGTSGVEPNIWHSMLLNDEGSFSPGSWPVEASHLLAGDLYDGYYGGRDSGLGATDLARYPWGWGAVALDANADGWMDVAFVGNNSSPPMTIIWDEEHGAGPGALLLNEEGAGFRDVTWDWGVPNTDDQDRYQDGRGIATGDLNNDGYADLVFANRSYNSSQSDPLSQEPGVPLVLLSHPREGNWLQVDLVGSVSNRDGIGSLIRVDNGERQHLYVLGAGGETNSSSERLLTVGVGSAVSVDIEVIFPSGQVERLSSVPVNQRVVIEEAVR
jgi:hypothetical protein